MTRSTPRHNRNRCYPRPRRETRPQRCPARDPDWINRQQHLELTQKSVGLPCNYNQSLLESLQGRVREIYEPLVVKERSSLQPVVMLMRSLLISGLAVMSEQNPWWQSAFMLLCCYVRVILQQSHIHLCFEIFFCHRQNDVAQLKVTN